MAELLRKAQAEEGVTQVTVRGPEGKYTMVKDFKIEDIYSNRVFLAYEVNGKALPRKHGFPLRLVAEGYCGYDWVKYVYNVNGREDSKSNRDRVSIIVEKNGEALSDRGVRLYVIGLGLGSYQANFSKW